MKTIAGRASAGRAQCYLAALALLLAGCGPPGTGQPSSYGAPTQPTPPPGGGQALTSIHIAAQATGKGAAAFGANPLVIRAGMTVTWTNDDQAPHTATSDTALFDSGTLAAGQSFSFTFNAPGTYPYHCAIHGAASMSGTIEVTSAAASTAAVFVPH